MDKLTNLNIDENVLKPSKAIEIVLPNGQNLTKVAPNKRKKEVIKYLKPEEVRTLLTVIYPRNYEHWFMFNLAYRLGLRVTEVLTLEKGFYDPFTHTLTIKHLKSRRFEFRTVPLPEDIEMLIKGFFAMYKSEDKLFNYSRQRVHQLTKKYSQLAGLPSWVHFHTLRHSFAMNYYNQTNDTFGLRKLLGHSRLSTTNIYAEMTQADLREKINSIKY